MTAAIVHRALAATIGRGLGKRALTIAKQAKRATGRQRIVGLFGDPPKRPPKMRAATYAWIMAELEPLKTEINSRVEVQMVGANGPLGGWGR
jgi:hypothetical protein